MTIGVARRPEAVVLHAPVRACIPERDRLALDRLADAREPIIAGFRETVEGI